MADATLTRVVHEETETALRGVRGRKFGVYVNVKMYGHFGVRACVRSRVRGCEQG